MNLKYLIVGIVMSLFVLGCAPAMEEIAPVPSVPQLTEPEPKTNPPVVEEETAPTPLVTSEEAEPEAPSLHEYTLEGDDYGFYPATLELQKGILTKLTLTTRSAKVYYAGLDFRSSYFTTGKVPKGESKTVEFTPEKDFTITSYWPSSGVKKAELKVIVK